MVAFILIVLAFASYIVLKDQLLKLFDEVMGGNTSRDDASAPPSRVYSSQYSNNYPAYDTPQQDPHSIPSYPPYPAHVQSAPPPSQNYEPRYNVDTRRRRLHRTFSRIADEYGSLDEVTDALAEAGLESSNLIVGIDFTKSNEWTGKLSFNRRSLHHIGDFQNPYEQALSIIGKTLSSFDEDNLIPCFGFGDASTHDQDVFSFYPDGQPCEGFEEALSQYRAIVPNLRLAGPTSFAPIIETAMTIVEESGGQYHVLLIIADGQVTRSVNTGPGLLSSQEQKTVDAIVQASNYPLSIVLVGVGDGPWDMMREFDDNIPQRSFDNFQFVNFTEVMSKNASQHKKETEFALSALMEIPAQYKATLEMGILGHRTGRSPGRVALPTPVRSYSRAPSFGARTPQPPRPQYNPPSYSGYDKAASSTATKAPTSSASFDNQACPICLTNKKNMAFGCGHQTCCDCGIDLETCPICRGTISTRIKLY